MGEYEQKCIYQYNINKYLIVLFHCNAICNVLKLVRTYLLYFISKINIIIIFFETHVSYFVKCSFNHKSQLHLHSVLRLDM